MPCKADAASVNWITSDSELAAATAGWGSVICLDTEFLRTDTFFPLPGLYQVQAENQIFLLDPLTINDWSGFVELLENPQVVIVMHACGEDLELMRHHIGAIPTNIFDTQVAYAFVSTSFSTSYANLVSSLLEVDLPKHETRSDWRQRPLSETQIRYASEDVVYLPELYRVLKADLERTGRESWFNETMQERGRYEPGDPDQHYRNNKRAWRLSGEDLSVLQRLTAWRERRAMDEDVPRNRIVWDEHLIEFAREPQLDADKVWETLPKPIARRYADLLVAEHLEGRSAEPLERLVQPLSQRQGAVSKRLKALARESAESLAFSPELLARKRDIEECIRHFQRTGKLSSAYLGWRHSLVGDQFQTILEAEA